MVYKFKVTIDEDSKFLMYIEILSSQTFYDLHDLIQEELEYDRSHLASFYVVNHSWKRLKEIPLIDMGDDKLKNVVTMENAVISNYIKDAHQKFIYVFDYINDRFLKLELEETKPEVTNMYYPVCTDFQGEIPPQIGRRDVRNIMDDDETDDLDTLRRKPIPILDEDLEDFPSLPIDDKDIEPPFDIDLGEEEEEFEEDLDGDDNFLDEDFDNDDENFNDEEFDDEEENE